METEYPVHPEFPHPSTSTPDDEDEHEDEIPDRAERDDTRAPEVFVVDD